MVNISSFCVVVTSVITIVMCLYYWNISNTNSSFISMYRKKILVQTFLDCDRHELRTTPYQYNNFWIMPNYVLPKKVNPECMSDLTITMQGRPHDVYKLLDIYHEKGISVERGSFAVYILTTEDVVATITAIRYVKKCYYVVYDFLDRSKKEYIINDMVSFHIYYRLEQRKKLHIPRDIYALLSEPIDCEFAKREMEEIIDRKPHSYTTDDVAVITGRNIAKQESATLLSLGLDQYSYPRSTMFFYLYMELIDYLHSANTSRMAQKLILAVFTIPIRNMVPTDHYIRMKRFKLSKSVGEIRPVASEYSTLQRNVLAYISFRNTPLLDDRENMSIAQSEELWLLNLLLDDYEIYLLKTVFVVRNVSAKSEIETSTGQERREIQTINPLIRNEYLKIYGEINSTN